MTDVTQTPLFLDGVMQEKIWGGNKLREIFDYEIPSDQTGELWAISAHKNGPAVVKNGPLKGKTLAECWDDNREIFGNQEGDVFPLLTKILDAKTDLSVQVHPDDTYGLANEGELGKTECWYVIDAEPGSEIIYGHHAKSTEELEQMIADGKWDDLLRKVPVKAGDFFYVPSGTIHAIGGGILILETQQSSDTTYRVYDYDRRDDEGNTRPLHIKQSVDVTTIPHVDPEPEKTVIHHDNATLTTYVDNEFFSVSEWDIHGEEHFNSDSLYTLVSVIEGEGSLTVGGEVYPVEKGTHFILPHGVQSWTLDGTMQIIASSPGDHVAG